MTLAEPNQEDMALARKNVLKPFKLNGNTPQSLSASFNSPATVIQYADNIAYQINVTTSDSVGSFAVQVSLDYEVDSLNPANIINPGTWDSLTLSGTPAVAAANDSIVISLNQVPFTAIRLAYTSAIAGTGVCDMLIATKQTGG